MSQILKCVIYRVATVINLLHYYYWRSLEEKELSKTNIGMKFYAFKRIAMPMARNIKPSLSTFTTGVMVQDTELYKTRHLVTEQSRIKKNE